MFRLLGIALLLAVASGCGKGGGTKPTDSGAPGPSARIAPPPSQAKIPTTAPLVPIVKLPPVTPSGLSAEEQMILDLFNQVRTAEKLPLLKTDPILMKLAREQAARSAKTRQNGTVSADDVKAAGYEFTSFSSGAGGAQGGDPRQEIGNWIKSTLRLTATEAGYEELGIGFAKADGEENRYFYTAVFAKRRK